MGRHSNFPDEVESLRTLEIDYFIRENLIKPHILNSGTITWTNTITYERNSIGYEIKTDDNKGILRLTYIHKFNNRVCYDIELITRESNLGFGKMWYFVCPKTKKVCRKLHLMQGYFFHRTAFKELYYQQQIQSKQNRILYSRAFTDAYKDDVEHLSYKKYFKRYYRGKITKTYARILKRLEKASQVNLSILDRWL